MSAFARLRLFRPILAGATLRDRALACLGAFFGIGLAGLAGGLAAISGFGDADLATLLWIVPPMGASAVLVFAVPASPMAQPWATIGGNVVSTTVGVIIAHILPLSPLSAGLAVALAIGAMSLLRCLHPPGGAAALVGLFVGATSGWLFPLMPVALNAVVLVGVGWVFHRLRGRSYPHVAPPAPAVVPVPATDHPFTFSRSDLAVVLEEIGQPYDISAEDLEALLRRVEQRALARSYKDLQCADLMTKGVMSVRVDDEPEKARALLVEQDVRRLAVLDTQGVLVGVVGLRELVRSAASVGEIMSVPATTSPDAPAIGLLDRYARERVHAVFVIDGERRPVGVVTEADWLAVLIRGLN